jgi:lysozyme family protein
MKVEDIISAAQDKSSVFRAWLSLMLKWEVETDSYGNIKDEYLADGQGRTLAGLTSASDGLPITGTPSANFISEIYYRKYWLPFAGLPLSVAEITANYGLNMGKETAIKLLQTALGAPIIVDGILGDNTMRAAWQTDQHDLSLRLIDLGRAHYEEIGHGSRARFLAGWLNRNEAIKVFA